MPKLNILAISHNYPHSDDPSCGIFTARQLLGLRDAGVDITVVVPLVYAPAFINRFERYKLYRPRQLIQYDRINSFVVRFPRPAGKWPIRWDGLSCYVCAKNRILQWHKNRPFDLIYARCLFPEGDVGVRLSRQLRIPVVGVGIGHDVNLVPYYSRSLYRHYAWIINNLSYVIATGQSVADKIESQTHRTATVIGGVVNLEEFIPTDDKRRIKEELGLPVNSLVALFAGHLERNKGIFELVDAFSNSKKSCGQLILAVCGDGIEGHSFREYVHKSGAADGIKLAGVVQPGMMHKWMQASDVFVLPTYHEGMPNVVMEAMACGLPVVTTAVGGLPAAVGDCEGAILIQPKRVDELQRAILEVIKDRDLRSRMSTAARQKAEQHFGIKGNTRQLLKCFDEAIGSYKSTGRTASR